MRIQTFLGIVITVGVVSMAFGQSRSAYSERGSLREGDRAPDFDLEELENHDAGRTDPGRVRLSDFEGEKPVVLIFGSYT